MKKVQLLSLLAAVALGGCYSVNTVQNADTTARVNLVPDKRVVWDNTMAAKLDLGQISETTVSGLRKIQVQITNKYAYHMDFVYKVEWFDAAGMKIDGTDLWKRLRLEAHETSTISAIAETPKAHDFVIKFQEAAGNNTIF